MREPGDEANITYDLNGKFDDLYQKIRVFAYDDACKLETNYGSPTT